MVIPQVTFDGRQSRIQEEKVERQPRKKLGTTSKTGGIGKEVEQLTYESWLVKDKKLGTAFK